MKMSRTATAACCFTIAAMVAAGCSSDSTAKPDGSSTSVASAAAANGSQAAFCDKNAEIDAVLADIDSAEAAVAAFTKAQPLITEILELAPASIKADVQAMADAADGALATTDFSAFESGELAPNEKRIAEFCGNEGPSDTQRP